MITLIRKKQKTCHNKNHRVSYVVSGIAEITGAKFLQHGEDVLIENLLTDSRKLLFPKNSLFFSLPGSARKGNTFIKTLYDKEVRNFIVDDSFPPEEAGRYPDTNFLLVHDVLFALQKLAAYHRHQYRYPVIGITGSNGKTIVKEWLNQLLGEEHNIVRSPKSYNSQVGVPLSVWRMHESNTLGIFESGISKPGEMKNLQKIIDPDIGIITFMGAAHAEGFVSKEQKIREKLQLFLNSNLLVYCNDDEQLANEVSIFRAEKNGIPETFTWGSNEQAHLQVIRRKKNNDSASILCVFKKESFEFSIPFTDDASINNAITCCSVLLAMGIPIAVISEKMQRLRAVEMRMELKQGINNCSVINDGYSADLNSLSISLDFLEQQKQHTRRTVILSDFLQSGKDTDILYQDISTALKGKHIQRFIGIGPEISAHAASFSSLDEKHFYHSTEDFLRDINQLHFENETILIKGARIFRFEKISNALARKSHDTFLEVNLNAIRHNLAVYRQLLRPGVKIMAMVKAFSYGSGSYEVANLLQHTGIDYLAVAYTDEGVDLRRAGISLPIMVMNAETSGFDNLNKYKLEPEIFSFNLLSAFKEYLLQNETTDYPVHLKIDTGMHRLGFVHDETTALCNILKDQNAMKIVSVFSHLAGSDSADHDGFTKQQVSNFNFAADEIEQALNYSFFRHMANSSSIYRHPEFQMDMVRLGIGLYGIDTTGELQYRLQPVTALKTTVSQIKKVKKGESIGYSRKGIALRDSEIATVRIGYADGYPRLLSNGKGKMIINGNAVPVIGNICMDMTMLDVTGTDAEEGDTVIVFGEELPVTELALQAETIPYEILTNISQRVKRVYFEE